MLKKILIVCSVVLFSLVSQAKTSKILIIGDSLTAGYGVSQAEAYPNQLQMLLKEKGQDIQVINAGSSGSTSASSLGRLKWHLKSKPDLLILALGANDGLRGTKVETTKENLSKTIDLAQKNGIKVFLAGMKLPMNYGDKYRKDFESVFETLVKEKKIHFIPFLLKGVGGETKLNQADGIHPNEKGHKIIAKTVLQAIESEL